MARSRTYIATPPGATIKEQLDDRGITQKEFAARMGMSEKHISKLINGEVQLTQETAARLEIVLGVPAKFWNDLEAIYREKLVKVNRENNMRDDIELAGKFPYHEMAKLGWVPDTTDKKEMANNLRRYFEIVDLSLLDNELITKIACRRLAVSDKDDLAIMAWVQEARLKAREQQTAQINIKGLAGAVQEIREMSALEGAEFFEKVKGILAEYGIALVLLPRLEGASLRGASFRDGNRMVISLTEETVESDKFKSDLLHEMAHIVLGHVGNNASTSARDEEDADKWAAAMLGMTAVD